MQVLKQTNSVASFLSHPQQWQAATWDDYLALRDDDTILCSRLFFYQERLWIEMGEGLNHAKFNNLLTMLLFAWKQLHPDQSLTSLGGCQLEKEGEKACAPDMVIYLNKCTPDWVSGQRRYLNLDQVPVPNLVGEIADTTLADDLDEKKKLYASLGIPEYWVIDVKGERIFAFALQDSGVYGSITNSIVLEGLSMALIEQTIARLGTEANTDAAIWFLQQIQ